MSSMTDKPSETSTSPDPTNVPISAAGYCLPWEPLVYALDRIVDLGPIHGPGRAAAEARYGRIAAVLVTYPVLADEVERLRLIESGARDSEALVAHLRSENEALRKELAELKHSAMDFVSLVSELDAERARADAMAAKEEEIENFRRNLGRDPLVKCPWLGAAREALNSTPSADLEAHDAKVRESLELTSHKLFTFMVKIGEALGVTGHWNPEIVLDALPAHDARVRREALEGALYNTRLLLKINGTIRAEEQLKAAILGPNAQPNEQEGK